MSTAIASNIIELQCRHWVEHFIIKRAICPFAQPVFESDEVLFQVIETKDQEQQILALMGQVQQMQTNSSPETALLIIPNGQEHFFDFLNLLDICNQLLEQQDQLDFVQLASFHPDYLFEGEDVKSPSHYTNRSPWPMLHLIRQSSISEALQHFRDPEGIPVRNIALMEELGITALEQQLQQIKGMH